MLCMNCDSDNDVTEFERDKAGKKEVWRLCVGCRYRLAIGELNLEPRMGRPPIGESQKVSITMPPSSWKHVDREADGNRSEYFRKLVERDMWPAPRWSNEACLGYVLSATRHMGYPSDQIEELMDALQHEFDIKTVTEAERLFKGNGGV